MILSTEWGRISAKVYLVLWKVQLQNLPGGVHEVQRNPTQVSQYSKRDPNRVLSYYKYILYV